MLLKRFILFLLIILSFQTVDAIAFSYYKPKQHLQKNSPGKNPKKIFRKAIKYFNEDQFYQALPLFLQLVEIDPENPSYNFYVGFCMQMLNYNANEILPYFEKAVVETTIDFQQDYKERRSPLIAKFYLGKIYHFLNRFDEAVEYYIQYRNDLPKSETKLIREVNKEIENSYNAKKGVLSQLTPEQLAQKKLLDSSVVQTSSIKPKEQVAAIFQSHSLPRGLRNINTKSSEFSAQMVSPYRIIFTSDRRDSIINSRLPEGIVTSNIYYIEKENNQWLPPKLVKNVNSVANEVYGSLTPDGKTLYLHSDLDGNDDILVSRKIKENKWSRPKSPAKGINTQYSETSPYISLDGNWLFFCSNRPGGKGGKDIYYCTKNEKGDWSKPQNAGEVINSPFDEESPCFDAENQILYFSSKGHNSLGGYDIFYSKLNGKTWTKPVNLGLPISSVYDDLYFSLPYGGNLTFYCSNRSKSPNDFDLYAIEDFDPEDFIKIDTLEKNFVSIDEKATPEKLDSLLSELRKIDQPIRYKGIILNHENKPVKAQIQILESRNNALFGKPVTDEETGAFQIMLEPKTDYTMWIFAPDYLKEPEVFKLDVKEAMLGKPITTYIGLNPDNRKIKAVAKQDSLLAGNITEKPSVVKETPDKANNNISLQPQKENAQPTQQKDKTEQKRPAQQEQPSTKPNIAPVKSEPQAKPELPKQGDYTLQIAASAYSADVNFTQLDYLVRSKGKDGIWRYYYGKFATKEEALQQKKQIQSSSGTAIFVTRISEKDEELSMLTSAKATTGAGKSEEGATWTVQLGAGKMRFDYFKKFSDVKVCDGKDNMRRFIIGEFRTKAEAIAMKKEAIRKGYYDAWTPKVDENRQFCHDLQTIEENEKLQKQGLIQAAFLNVNRKVHRKQKSEQYYKGDYFEQLDYNTYALSTGKKTKKQKKSFSNLWGLLASK